MCNAQPQLNPEIKEAIKKSNLFFPTFFRIQNEFSKNIFVYQNDSDVAETISVVLFPVTGMLEGGGRLITQNLQPNEFFLLDDTMISKATGDAREGTILACLQTNKPVSKISFRKEFISNWLSVDDGWTSGAMVGIGPFSTFNTPETKKKRSFSMFAPVVYKKGEIQTENVLINHSSSPDYTDRIEITPTLSNMNGEIMFGKKILIEPFGHGVIDIEKTFGEEGEILVEKTGGYGYHGVAHTGHLLASYFVQLDNRGNFLCGNHTQPPSGILGVATLPQALKEKIKLMLPASLLGVLQSEA